MCIDHYKPLELHTCIYMYIAGMVCNRESDTHAILKLNVHYRVHYYFENTAATIMHIQYTCTCIHYTCTSPILGHLVYINRVVCQTSYGYVQVRRANKLETAVQESLACLAPSMKMFCAQNAHVYVHVSVVTLGYD